MTITSVTDTRATVNSLASLESRDTKSLLDIIDDLRSQGISQYVDLPQIIVCGEQSSGKSSVLEAISGMSFPTKDTVCTRFPTEVMLRYSTASKLKFSVVQGPTQDSRYEQVTNQELEGLGRSGEIGLVDLTQAIERAKKVMGIHDGVRTFSSDILRVELSGPTTPNLTLVDLPGLYQAGSISQPDADSEVVKSLVLSYMENQRSIILAVVSAKNDFSNQSITNHARSIDKLGQRTMGLITKPDTLHHGSESEKFYVRLARNEEVPFKLGWHVLRNRDFPERNMSLVERNEKEKSFFRKGVWTSVDVTRLGVDFLKERLSTVLKKHIVSQLPNVMVQIEDGIFDCKTRLTGLGAPRGTPAEQRRYLYRVGNNFNEILKDTINGKYTHPFFEDASTMEGYRKRLRAVIQNTLTVFAEDMRVRGHTFNIFDEDSDSDEDNDEQAKSDYGESKSEQDVAQLEADDKEIDEDGTHGPKQISRRRYLMKVTDLLRRSRGRELPGLFDPMFVGELFYEQCRPWGTLVTECVKVLVNATYSVINNILEEVCDGSTKDALMSSIIAPRWHKIRIIVDEKLVEILKAHRSRHPITYNADLVNAVQEIRKKRQEDELTRIFDEVLGRGWGNQRVQPSSLDTGLLMRRLSNSLEANMDAYACSNAADFMRAYYEIARKTLVDMISGTVIEDCLLQKALSLFRTDSIIEMDDSLVVEIAAENGASVAQRERLVEKLNVLENGLEVLRKLNTGFPNHITTATPKSQSHNSSLQTLEQSSDKAHEIYVESADIVSTSNQRLSRTSNGVSLSGLITDDVCASLKDVKGHKKSKRNFRI